MRSNYQRIKEYTIAATIINLLLLVGLVAFAWADTDIVCETIAREASGESFEAQVWVASVIKTRMQERRKTAEEVCLEKWQFSCWNPGVKQKPRTKKELETARRAWEKAEANGANLYHDLSVLPYWAESSKVTFLIQIDRLKFYRERR